MSNHGNEAVAKERNIESHRSRDRQWQTVGSSDSDSPPCRESGSKNIGDISRKRSRSNSSASEWSSSSSYNTSDSDSDAGSGSESGSDNESGYSSASSDNRDHKKHKKHHRHKSREDEKEHRSSSSSSSSKSDKKKEKKHRKDKHKRDKKHGKDKKHSKDSKHRKHKKDKKNKKDKKDKKDHKHHKSDRGKPGDTVYNSVAVNQNEYGKYGIIKETDYFAKQREFEAYMTEVKKLPDVMGLSKRDVMMHFKSYIEDYNTATMPHDKYYQLEAWEMHEHQRKKMEEYNKSGAGGGNNGYGADDGTGGMVDLRADEEERRLQRKQTKALEQQRVEQSVLLHMKSDKDKIEHMKRQAALTAEQQLAFKRGDKETLKRVERLLAPDIEKAVKHPWA